MHTHRAGAGISASGRPSAIRTGELSGLGLPAGTKVQGEITLGSFSDDPYELPYDVALSCVDPDIACTFYGTLGADGTLRLSPSFGSAGEEVVLGRTGASTCTP